MLPLATKQDTPGPITKSVQDTAYLLDVLAEQYTVGSAPDYLASCKTIDIQGLRIGVPSASFPSADVVVLNQFEDAMRTLENAGATIVRGANFAATEEYNSMTKSQQQYVLAGSFQQDIKTYLESLATNPRKIHDLHDLIRLTKEIPEEEYPIRGIEQLELAETIDVNGPEFKAALEKNNYLAGKGGILGTIEEYNLDVIAAPAMFGPAVTFAARGGLPVIVMPLGAYPDGTELKYYRNGPVETIDIGPNVPYVFISYPCRNGSRPP
jgi:amidase